MIISFPTKKHWKHPSKLLWIKLGLYSLVLYVFQKGIKSVAIPALGCGEGGLDWDVVRPLIFDIFNDMLSDVDVFLYQPLSLEDDSLRHADI